MYDFKIDANDRATMYRDLASALKLPNEALDGMTIDVEVEELREEFQKVRKGPPPPPPGAKKGSSVDIDID
jgi:hypothetical protein